MAWIVKLPPTPRHPQTRWQVRYRDGTTQRSTGIYPTKAEARSVQRAVERGDHVAHSNQLSPQPGSMLFGEYVTTIWWPAWKPAHPRSAEGTSSKLTAAEPSLPRMIWFTRPQVQRLADAIDPRYRALVILAAHTGARWSELITLRWIDVRTNFPLDDGAISGPGRLRIRPPTPVDQEEKPASRGRSRSRSGGRTIALDHDAIDALHAHRDLVNGRAHDLVFTSRGGSRGPAGPLASANFARIWQRALSAAELDQVGPDQKRPHFHDLRHTHAVWLLAQQAPIGAIAKRLGHANPVVTMSMYQLAATQVHEGQLTTHYLGLTTPRPRGRPG